MFLPKASLGLFFSVEDDTNKSYLIFYIRYFISARWIGKPICQSDSKAEGSWKLQIGEIEFTGHKLLGYRQRMRAGVGCGERDGALKVGVCVCVCGGGAVCVCVYACVRADAVALGD